MGSQWPGMLSNFMKLDVFRKTLQHLDDVLKPLNFNLIQNLHDKSGRALKAPKTSLISIIAIEVQKCIYHHISFVANIQHRIRLISFSV